MFFLCISSQNAYVNINRIMSVASRLSEAGHYASQQIKQISGQLDQEWKSFAAALDERSAILAMSSVFHQKAEQVGAHTCSFLLGPHLYQVRYISGQSVAIVDELTIWLEITPGVLLASRARFEYPYMICG